MASVSGNSVDVAEWLGSCEDPADTEYIEPDSIAEQNNLGDLINSWLVDSDDGDDDATSVCSQATSDAHVADKIAVLGSAANPGGKSAIDLIHQETQRLVRETPVVLPYHRPTPPPVSEFLQRLSEKQKLLCGGPDKSEPVSELQQRMQKSGSKSKIALFLEKHNKDVLSLCPKLNPLEPEEIAVEEENIKANPHVKFLINRAIVNNQVKNQEPETKVNIINVIDIDSQGSRLDSQDIPLDDIVQQKTLTFSASKSKDNAEKAPGQGLVHLKAFLTEKMRKQRSETLARRRIRYEQETRKRFGLSDEIEDEEEICSDFDSDSGSEGDRATKLPESLENASDAEETDIGSEDGDDPDSDIDINDLDRLFLDTKPPSPPIERETVSSPQKLQPDVIPGIELSETQLLSDGLTQGVSMADFQTQKTTFPEESQNETTTDPEGSTQPADPLPFTQLFDESGFLKEKNKEEENQPENIKVHKDLREVFDVVSSDDETQPPPNFEPILTPKSGGNNKKLSKKSPEKNDKIIELESIDSEREISNSDPESKSMASDPELSEGQTPKDGFTKTKKYIKKRTPTPRNDESSDEEGPELPEIFFRRQERLRGNKKVEKEIRKTYLENEAQLSGSDQGSDGEIGSEDDVMEEEAGDKDDVGSVSALRNKLSAIYAREQKDEDDRQIRLMKEMYLVDGELHSETIGRVRSYRWSATQEAVLDAKFRRQGDTQRGESESSESDEEQAKETQWRLERFQRQQTLRENSEKVGQPEEEDCGKENDSQFSKFSLAFLQKRSFSLHKDTEEINRSKAEEKDEDLGQPNLGQLNKDKKVKNEKTLGNLRFGAGKRQGSFLGRRESIVAKMRELNSFDLAANMKQSDGKRFVFTVENEKSKQKSDLKGKQSIDLKIERDVLDEFEPFANLTNNKRKSGPVASVAAKRSKGPTQPPPLVNHDSFSNSNSVFSLLE